MTRLRNLTRTDCDTNFGTKFGEQNVQVEPIRPSQRTQLKYKTIKLPSRQRPTGAVGFALERLVLPVGF